MAILLIIILDVKQLSLINWYLIKKYSFFSLNVLTWFYKYLHQDKTNCDILIDNHDNTILNEASDTKHLNGDVRSNIDEIDAFLTEKQDEGEGLWMKLKGRVGTMDLEFSILVGWTLGIRPSEMLLVLASF